MTNSREHTHVSLRTLITSYIESEKFYPVDDNWAPIDTMLRSPEFEFVLKNINGFITIFNYNNGLYEYVSEGLNSYLGFNTKDLLGEAGVNFVYSLIYPEHRSFLVDTVMSEVLQYLSVNATYKNGTDFRFNYCIKLKNNKDQFSWYILDAVIIQTNELGFPLRTMITCTNIDSYKKDDLLFYNILKKDASGIFQVIYKGHANSLEDEMQLTARETEIIALISQGLTNKQIAEKLGIAGSTVETHRKKILGKTKCKGTAELVNYAFARGIV